MFEGSSGILGELFEAPQLFFFFFLRKKQISVIWSSLQDAKVELLLYNLGSRRKDRKREQGRKGTLP